MQTVEPYRWRDRYGNKHKPEDMRTTHIFYVLRMVWNHTADYHAKVNRNYNEYSFSSHYSDGYIVDTLRELGAELKTRDINELNPQQRGELTRMILRQDTLPEDKLWKKWKSNIRKKR